MMTAASASMSWRHIRIEEGYCRGRDPKEVPRLGRRHGRYAARQQGQNSRFAGLKFPIQAMGIRM